MTYFLAVMVFQKNVCKVLFLCFNQDSKKDSKCGYHKKYTPINVIILLGDEKQYEKEINYLSNFILCTDNNCIYGILLYGIFDATTDRKWC